ncbi:MAG: YraN family protein [Anaerolineae bacterium]|nr:YraN family protein [Anaerolineae bacterium]
MSHSRVGLGRRGEELAVTALTRRGYDVVARNWRCQAGEVDIVARTEGTWVFIEVRTRRGPAFGTPEESLTPAKLARMATVAESYLAEHDLHDVDWRLDLVAVVLDDAGRLDRLDVLENVTW